MTYRFSIFAANTANTATRHGMHFLTRTKNDEVTSGRDQATHAPGGGSGGPFNMRVGRIQGARGRSSIQIPTTTSRQA